MINSAQTLNSIQKIYCHELIFDKLIAHLKKRFQEIVKKYKIQKYKKKKNLKYLNDVIIFLN
jgi:hypothetical protein